jgi:hypothetical protein
MPTRRLVTSVVAWGLALVACSAALVALQRRPAAAGRLHRPYAVPSSLQRHLEAHPDAALAPVVDLLLRAPPLDVRQARLVYGDALARLDG